MEFVTYMCMVFDDLWIQIQSFLHRPQHSSAEHTSDLVSEPVQSELTAVLGCDPDSLTPSPTAPLCLSKEYRIQEPTIGFDVCYRGFQSWCYPLLILSYYHRGRSGQSLPYKQRSWRLPCAPAADGETAACWPRDDALCSGQPFKAEYSPHFKPSTNQTAHSVQHPNSGAQPRGGRHA